MYCIKCGSELVENAKFCSKCGYPVSRKEPEVKPEEKADNSESRTSGKNKYLFIIPIAAVLGCCLLGAAVFFAWKIISVINTERPIVTSKEDIINTPSDDEIKPVNSEKQVYDSVDDSGEESAGDESAGLLEFLNEIDPIIHSFDYSSDPYSYIDAKNVLGGILSIPGTDYSAEPYEYGGETLYDTDPLNKIDTVQGYHKINAEKVDWVLRNVFNVSDAGIAAMKKRLNSDEPVYSYDGHDYVLRYYSDGYYYVSAVNMNEGWLGDEKHIKTAEKENDYYLVTFYDFSEYRAGYDFSSIENPDVDPNITTHNAVLKLKDDNGKAYWSLYYYDVPFDNIDLLSIDSKTTDTDKNDEAAESGSQYKFFEFGLKWKEAELFCESVGGHLMSVNSAEEQAIAEELVKGSNKKNIWLGGYLDTDGEWKWTDGTDFKNYSNWEDRGTDNYSGDEKYVRFSNGNQVYGGWEALAGRWDDTGEMEDAYYDPDNVSLYSFGFICEWNPGDIRLEAPLISFGNDEIFGNSKYKYLDYGMTWDDAERYCEAIGGHLVSIGSSDEQALAENLARNSSKENTWIGGFKRNNTWYWTDGSDFSYSNWEDWGPDNYEGKEYVARFSNITRDYSTWACHFGKWDDTDLIADGMSGDVTIGKFGFICEWN